MLFLAALVGSNNSNILFNIFNTLYKDYGTAFKIMNQRMTQAGYLDSGNEVHNLTTVLNYMKNGESKTTVSTVLAEKSKSNKDNDLYYA